MNTSIRIIDTAIDNGADIAGIASMKALQESSSSLLYEHLGIPRGRAVADHLKSRGAVIDQQPGKGEWVLVIGINHPAHLPELDWWDGNGTPGNRMLIDSLKRTEHQLQKTLGIACHKLHYFVEKGGVFLKDAAVLAGLGCIGRNNLLITPGFGPRIRLRALLLEADLQPTGPIRFDPCAGCSINCRNVCPEKSMSAKRSVPDDIEVPALPARDGAYDRDLCGQQMDADILKSEDKGGVSARIPVKFCRKCELICPLGKDGEARAGQPATEQRTARQETAARTLPQSDRYD